MAVANRITFFECELCFLFTNILLTTIERSFCALHSCKLAWSFTLRDAKQAFSNVLPRKSHTTENPCQMSAMCLHDRILLRLTSLLVANFITSTIGIRK